MTTIKTIRFSISDQTREYKPKDYMPLMSYISLSMILTVAAPFICVVLAQLSPVDGPGPKDAWACLGAILATGIMVIGEGRPGSGLNWRFKVISIFISSSFFGAFGPGFAIYSVLPALNYFFPSWEWTKNLVNIHLTWQGWAILGFVLGIFGWATVRLLIKLSNTLSMWGEKKVNDKLGLNREPMDWVEKNDRDS